MELLLGIALIVFGRALRRAHKGPQRIIVEHVIRFEEPPPGPGEPLVLTGKNVIPFRRRA